MYTRRPLSANKRRRNLPLTAVSRDVSGAAYVNASGGSLRPLSPHPSVCETLWALETAQSPFFGIELTRKKVRWLVPTNVIFGLLQLSESRGDGRLTRQATIHFDGPVSVDQD